MSTELDVMTVKDLRNAARHFAPEARGAGGLAHTGTKEQLIALLQEKGVMPGEVDEFLRGNDKIEAPEELPAPFLSDKTKEIIDSKMETIRELADQIKGYGKAEEKEPDELELIRRIITKNVKPDIDPEKITQIIDRKFDEFRKSTVKVIEIKQVDELPNKVIGACHKLTEQIAQVCNLGIHQMLVGPAGGGKTTCCEKVAEILNLKFYPMSVGPQTTKSDLLGFIDAAGNYHTTPLREAFENGGLLLLDEVDAANAGVLTIINALLANGYCSFPDGVKQRNESFRCICACNTYGRGADREYVGRNQLDAATLDRFAVVDFDYDDELERAIAGNNTWVEKVQRYRKRAFELKMRVVISPRASIHGAKLIAAGMSEKLAEELTVWKGVSAEIRSKIQA